MGFTPNIPASGQSLGNSRTQVLNNFATLRTAAGSATVATGDHYDVNGANIGKHKWVHLPNVSVSPGVPTTSASEIALYSKITSTTLDLHFRRISDGIEVQLTGNVPYGAALISSTPAKTGTQVTTFLPGGLVFISGYVLNSAASQQVNYGYNITNIVGIQLTRYAIEGSPPSNRSFHQVTASVAGSFTFRNLDEGGSAAAGFNVFWSVIGIL